MLQHSSYCLPEESTALKILITTDLYDPSVSGVVSSVKVLANGLRKNGHDVRILTLSDTHKEKKDGNVYYISSFSASAFYPQARIAFFSRSKMIRELIEWNPDIIHTNCELSTFNIAVRISKKTQTPIVHTYHTFYEAYLNYVPMGGGHLIKYLLPCLVRAVSRKARMFIAPTEKTARLLKTFHISIPVSVIPSAINDAFFTDNCVCYREELRKKHGIEKDECIFMYLGRVAKEKNIEELLDYASCEEMKDYRILIAGDGPYRSKLERYCKKLGISDRIIFIGMVPPKEVQKYYAAGDIFINSSLSETQGLTYLEAMSCSLPVLCRYDTCLDGVVENGKNGFVFNNKEEFLRYAKLLAEDSLLRKTVGEKAKKTIVDNYSSDKYIKSCEDLYFRIINDGLQEPV